MGCKGRRKATFMLQSNSNLMFSSSIRPDLFASVWMTHSQLFQMQSWQLLHVVLNSIHVLNISRFISRISHLWQRPQSNRLAPLSETRSLFCWICWISTRSPIFTYFNPCLTLSNSCGVTLYCSLVCMDDILHSDSRSHIDHI